MLGSGYESVEHHKQLTGYQTGELNQLHHIPQLLGDQQHLFVDQKFVRSFVIPP